MSWLGNLLMILGSFRIGSKHRSGFLFAATGEIIWTGVGIARNELDLSLICLIFAVLAIVNWFRWGKDS